MMKYYVKYIFVAVVPETMRDLRLVLRRNTGTVAMCHI
jgi:hypothetical protein